MKEKNNKSHKLGWSLLIFITLIILGVFSVYLYSYRMHKEPPTKLTKTNTDAAIYKTNFDYARSLINDYPEAFKSDVKTLLKLKSKKNIKKLNAIINETTIVVPGMKATKTIKATKKGKKKTEKIDMCTSMTPQGLAVSDKYVFISAYCHTHTHNSVIYVIDKKTHKFIKEIALPEKSHVGGLAYDYNNDVLWISGSINSRAAANAINLKSIKKYDIDKAKSIKYSDRLQCRYLEAASFMCYASFNNKVTKEQGYDESKDYGFLLAGYFNNSNHSYLRAYGNINYLQLVQNVVKSANNTENILGSVANMQEAVEKAKSSSDYNDKKYPPTDLFGFNLNQYGSEFYEEPILEGDVGKKIQGLAIATDKDGNNGALLTESYGPNNSKLIVYSTLNYDLKTQVLNLNTKKSSKKYTLPPKLEQVTFDQNGDKSTYLLFESSAYCYRARGKNNMDRVVILDFGDKWIKK